MPRSTTVLRNLVIVALLSAGARPAMAVDFKSIGADPAVLFDAPTERGRKISIAPRGMPVEVVFGQGDWVRVRDATGELSWVEKKMLSDKRTLVASVLTSLYASADDHAPVVAHLQQGVIVDLIEAPADGWVHVHHRDGVSGWVRLVDVWGE